MLPDHLFCQFLTEKELALYCESSLRQIAITKNKKLRGFLPTGKSAQGLYQEMIARNEFWQDRLSVLQIDEFIQASSSSKGFFYQSLLESILKPLKLEQSCKNIDPNWSEQEFQQHIAQTLSQPIDYAILGFGPNGHIGFHEPHLNKVDFLGGKVQLSKESYSRVMGAPSEYAYTFGASSFLRAETIFLIVTGANKAESFARFLKQAPSVNLPATLLKQHPKLVILTTFASTFV